MTHLPTLLDLTLLDLPMPDQMIRYDRSACAVFCRTRDPYGGLSNMAAYPLTINDTVLRTSEALYQVCRFPEHPAVQADIIAQASPMTAKMVAHKHEALTRPDWLTVRVPLMAWTLRVKLLQHFSEFGDLLLATGDRPIVEESRRDEFWGARPAGDLLIGHNMLGRLEIDLRHHLIADPASLTPLLPPVTNMMLLGAPIGPVAMDSGG